MTKNHHNLALLPVILLALLGLNTVAFANVVTDPSFEGGTSTWRTDNTGSFVSSPTRTGTKALKMVNVGNGNEANPSASHDADRNSMSGVVPGQEYVYKVWVSGSNVQGVGNGGKPLAVVRWRDGGKSIIRTSTNKWKESFLWAPYGTYNFRQMTMILQAPSNAQFLDIAFRTWWGCTGGETYWEDVSLTPRDLSGLGNLLGTYQAEDANTKSGGSVLSDHLDYTGSGYYDVTTNNAVLQWNNVTGGGDRVLNFRFSWEGNVRPLELFVNGVSKGKHTPLPTGRRGIWASDLWNVNLPAGSNTVKLVIGKTGGLNSQPMFDKLAVYAAGGGGGGGTPPPPPPTPMPPASAPGNVMASDDAFNDRIAVGWNSVSGATYYEVYRSTSAGSNGSRIASPTGTSYNDFNATAGTTYYFRLKACNSDGCSGFSAQDAGRRAVAQQNQSPRVRLESMQGGTMTRWVAGNAGSVQLRAFVTDQNAGDTHSYDWGMTDNALVPMEMNPASTFTFDPSTLTPGVYVARVAVTDDGTPARSTNAELMLRVANTLPPLSNNNDSDNDSIGDADEGYGDGDNDGIPDYQDAISDPTLLQGEPANANTRLLQTENGLTLKLGQTAFASGLTAASITAQNLMDHGGSGGGPANNTNDGTFAYPVGIFDFEIGGLTQPGQSKRVVIPVMGPIPAGASYRKFMPATGWQAFVEDQNNTVSSAAGQPGMCPPPGDSAYTSGLTAGHYCVQLQIEDGGPNDADGSANASIRDPSAVAVADSSIGGTSSAGGGGGCSLVGAPRTDLLFYLMLVISIAYLGFTRKVKFRRK